VANWRNGGIGVRKQLASQQLLRRTILPANAPIGKMAKWILAIGGAQFN
jgi:hypothetical protein